MGRWDQLRRSWGTRLYGDANLRHDLNELEASIMLANPSIANEVMGGPRSFARGGGVEPLEQDFLAYLKAVGLFPWVTACIDAIASAAASVPFKLMRGRPGDAEEVEEHELLDLLANPNPDQGWYEFAYALHQHLGFTGEAMVVGVGIPDDTPFVNLEEIWPIRPDEVAPVFDKATVRRGRNTLALVGWTQTSEGGRVTRYPVESIIQAKRPHPRDPIRGLSPIKRVECALNLLWSVLQANKAYLANGAGPGLVLRMGIPPDNPLAKRFEQKMEASHAGTTNRGKNLYLYGKDIEVLKDRVMDSSEDAQYLEMMRLTREWILAEFKVPPFILSLLEHANWSNSVEQQRYFYQNAVVPANRLLFDAWNSSPLVQVWGEDLFLEHDYSEIAALQPDKTEASTRAVEQYKAGLITKNEARSIVGQDETPEGGDEFFQPVDPFAAEEMPPLMDADPMVRLARGAARWRQFDLRVGPLERRWEREWRSLLADLRAEVLEELNRQLAASRAAVRLANGDARVPFGVGPLFDAHKVAETWQAALAELAKRSFQKGAEDAHQESAGEFVPFDLNDPRAVAYVETKLAQRIRTIAENRLAEVTEIVTKATAEGAPIEELQTRIREHFGVNRIPWARRIARTETIGLYNTGAVAGMQDAGVQTKEWLSARDSSVRESHEEMDGTAIALEDDFVFPSGGRGPYPGQIDSAEENINCFLPDTLVRGSFVAGIRSEVHRAKVVELKTARGSRLSVTVNHPVLTSAGWKGAGDVREGDYLISHGPGIEGIGRVDPDYGPAVIQQVHGALAMTGQRSTIALAPQDLHGDGRFVVQYRKVEVVLAPRKLLDDVWYSTADQMPGELSLAASDVAAVPLPSDGALALPGDRVSAPTPSRPRGGELSDSEAPIRRGPLQPLRFGATANLDRCISESAGEDGARDPGLATDLLQRLPGLVLLDQVVEVRDFEFTGHVFDLQSASGLMVAENLIVHNCRCTVIPGSR